MSNTQRLVNRLIERLLAGEAVYNHEEHWFFDDYNLADKIVYEDGAFYIKRLNIRNDDWITRYHRSYNNKDEFYREMIRLVRHTASGGYLRNVTQQQLDIEREGRKHAGFTGNFSEFPKFDYSFEARSFIRFEEDIYFMGDRGRPFRFNKINKAEFTIIKDCVMRGGRPSDEILIGSFIKSHYEHNVLSRFYSNVPIPVKQKKAISEAGYIYQNINRLSKTIDMVRYDDFLGFAKHKDGNKFHITSISEHCRKKSITKADGSCVFIPLRKQYISRIIVDMKKAKIYYYGKGTKRQQFKSKQQFKNGSYYSQWLECGNVEESQLEKYLKKEAFEHRKAEGFYVTEDYSLHHIVRMPNLTTDLFLSIRYFPVCHKIPYDISGNGEACKILGVPVSLSGSNDIGFIAELMSSNTKKKKVITIDEAKTIAHNISCYYYQFYGRRTANDSTLTVLKDIACFIKALLKAGWSCKKIKLWSSTMNNIGYDCNHLKDTARMYCHSGLSKSALRNLIKDSRNPFFVHDTLVQMENIMRHQDVIAQTNANTNEAKRLNVVIKYPDGYVERINKVVGGYTFALVADSKEIIRIGNVMANCVGRNYLNDAINSRCSIVGVKNSKGYYVNCIEIRDDKLIQAKCFQNSYTIGVLRDNIISWAQASDLLTEECRDLDISNRRHSYGYTLSDEQIENIAETQSIPDEKGGVMSIEAITIINKNGVNYYPDLLPNAHLEDPDDLGMDEGHDPLPNFNDHDDYDGLNPFDFEF